MRSGDPTTPLYDDPDFFAKYEKMRALQGRLNEVVEVPVMMSLLPAVAGTAVADLGCGSGEMCRRLSALGAASVTGYDVSIRMLELARQSSTDMPHIIYQEADLESIAFEPASLDLLVSSLALHYVIGFEALTCRISASLRSGGSFVFSVEHPIVTCNTRDWVYADDGLRLHWPVDRYLDECPRAVRWLGSDDVPRFHRSVSGYLTALLRAGLVIRQVLEPGPDDAAVTEWPRLADQRRRPPFLIVRADKPGRSSSILVRMSHASCSAPNQSR